MISKLKIVATTSLRYTYNLCSINISVGLKKTMIGNFQILNTRCLHQIFYAIFNSKKVVCPKGRFRRYRKGVHL